MSLISVTLLVLKLVKSSSVRDELPQNIPLISVTSEVLIRMAVQWLAVWHIEVWCLAVVFILLGVSGCSLVWLFACKFKSFLREMQGIA